MVARKIHCDDCLKALKSSKERAPELFVARKSNGGLKIPADDLLKVCPETEKCVMRMVNSCHGGLQHAANISSAIAAKVLCVCVEEKSSAS